MSSTFRFSIGATFTAEPLQPAIAFWGRQLHLDFEIRFAPYNQLEQTLLDPRGEFAANTHGVNLIAIRAEDFGGLDLSRVRSNIQHFLDALGHATLAASTIVCLCPASIAFLADAERQQTAEELARWVGSAASHKPGVQFLDYHEIEEYYPVEDYEAPGGGGLGHIPYTETYYTALATALVRRAHAIARPPYKAIALDCDDTLWKGLCGEDGPAGVTVDEPHAELQRFMAERRDAGFLLTLASKNNESDVLEAFERHPESPLRLSDFTAWRINWESKADNLAGLARELNIGLDSFIFVDDNPKECAEVESGIPDVLALPLPSDSFRTPHFLRHVWAFDSGPGTSEDRKRSEYYARSRQFGSELRAASSLTDFLAQLGLEVRIAPVAPAELARVAQLTQRTNQFNITTIRRSEAEIEQLIEHDGYDCFAVYVTDRFGDYGLTGAVLTTASGCDLIVDTFLLSCRVLGRGVEHRVMAFLAQYASRRHLTAVVVRFDPTAKNAPARQFLDSLRAPEDALTYRLPLEDIRGLEWRPEATAAVAQPVPVRIAPTQRAAPDYTRIARTLSTPAEILAAIRSDGRGVIAAATETERQLAEIWADLLRAPAISASDNFFDLGGHSLLAVLLLTRIQETFGAELSIDDVYSGALTLAELAQRIDLLRMDGADSIEYEELLREIEGLSDDEARRMLADSELADGQREAEGL